MDSIVLSILRSCQIAATECFGCRGFFQSSLVWRGLGSLKRLLPKKIAKDILGYARESNLEIRWSVMHETTLETSLTVNDKNNESVPFFHRGPSTMTLLDHL